MNFIKKRNVRYYRIAFRQISLQLDVVKINYNVWNEEICFLYWIGEGKVDAVVFIKLVHI